jgi:hypothetical protein
VVRTGDLIGIGFGPGGAENHVVWRLVESNLARDEQVIPGDGLGGVEKLFAMAQDPGGGVLLPVDRGAAEGGAANSKHAEHADPSLGSGYRFEPMFDPWTFASRNLRWNTRGRSP